jgi:hypothetical protein
MVTRTGVLPSLAGGEGLGRRDLYRDVSWDRGSASSPYRLPWQGLLSCELVLTIPAAGTCLITELMYGRPRRYSS